MITDMNCIRFPANTFASPDLISKIDPNILNSVPEINPHLFNTVPDIRHPEDVQERSKEAAGCDKHSGFVVATKDMAGDEDEHQSCGSFQKPN